MTRLLLVLAFLYVGKSYYPDHPVMSAIMVFVAGGFTYASALSAYVETWRQNMVQHQIMLRDYYLDICNKVLIKNGLPPVKLEETAGPDKGESHGVQEKE